MNFFDSLQQTSYNQSTKDDVASFIMDYFSDTKSNTIYLVSKCFNNNSSLYENIFLVQKTIELKSQNLTKIARILIYIPINFPNQSPLFYLEKADTFSIPDIQNDINKSTYEIKVKSIINWRNMIDFEKIIKDIISSFSKIYPLYKLEIHKRKGIMYPENSYVPRNAIKIFINSSQQIGNNNIIKNPNEIDDQTFQNMNENLQNPNKPLKAYINVNNSNNNQTSSSMEYIYNNIINKFNNSQEVKSNFTDEEIKKILVDHTMIIIKEKFLKSISENEKISLNLNNIKSNYSQNIRKIGDKIEEGKKIIKTFESLNKEILSEIANLKDDIIKNSRLVIGFENYKEFVHIPPKEEHMMKLISMESTLEDFVYSFKKAFEKNVLSYDETMKNIRKISKELFIINFLKKKLNDE